MYIKYIIHMTAIIDGVLPVVCSLSGAGTDSGMGFLYRRG
jgi:hypothetical protein